jgi:hypothetical protein
MQRSSRPANQVRLALACAQGTDPRHPTRFVWCLCYSCSGLARPRGESISAIELPSPSAEQRPVSNAGNEARRLISCVKPVLQFGHGQLVFCMCYAVSRQALQLGDKCWIVSERSPRGDGRDATAYFRTSQHEHVERRRHDRDAEPGIL